MSLLFFFIFFLGIFFVIPSNVNAGGITRAPNNLGLISYWSFNDGVGTTATDFSGRGNDLTLSNFSVPPTSLSGWTSGKIGKGLALDGIDDIAVVSSNSFADDPSFMTISAWVKTSIVGGGNNRVIVSKNNNPATGAGWRLELNVGGSTDGSFGFYLQQAGGANYNESWTAGGYNDGKWHHVVATLGGGGGLTGTITLYVDGIDATAGNQPSGLLTTTSVALPVSIGDDGAGYRQRMVIDEVRMYNRALSASEVVSLYRSGAVVKKQANNLGLVGYWPMNEGEGTVAGDSSGFGNTGTFFNNVSWGLGKLGNSTYFRGGAFFDFISVKDPPSLNLNDNTMTISVWIKGAVPNASGGIFTKGCCGGYGLEIGSAGGTCATNDIAFLKSTIGFFCLGSVPGDTKWHHVVVVQSGSGINSYVDGLDSGVASLDTNSIVASPGIDLNIGSGQVNWAGNIDELRIYDRELSSDEVAALYKATYSLVNRTPTTVVSSGLVGYWPFDGKYVEWETGVVDDVSENGNDGQVVNMSTTTSPVVGKAGQALRFDGVDDAIDVSSAINLANSSFTVSAWAKRGAVTPFISEFFLSQGSASSYNMLQLGIDDNHPFCGFYSDDLYVLGTSILDTQWHHYACTYNASTNERIVYMDGVEIDGDTTGGDFVGTGTFYIGRQTALPVTYNGSIDEVRLYNRVLSPAEILTLYNTTK